MMAHMSTTPDRQLLQHLNTALWTVSEAYRRGFSEVIDPSRYGVLRVVVEADGLRPSEIAERLDILPSSVTRHVQLLSDAGMVVTSNNPEDKRSSLVRATEPGRQALAGFDDVGVQASAAVLSDWTEDDILHLTRLLNRLVEAWNSRGRHVRRPGQLGNY
jgi:DNA-binding MarR family transcriptional regulator